MTALSWDQTGERIYETGVSKGVLYIPDGSGAYSEGYAWNGLSKITEAPTGAAATPQFADNIKYLNLVSIEEFAATIDAFTYPQEFEQCEGVVELSSGVAIGQQVRKTFGLSYQTLIGNDVEATDYGYKIHLVYGALAAPSQRDYDTVNDTPAAQALSWAITTTPVNVTGKRPTASLVINSTLVDATALQNLENILYGTAGEDPRLPLPDEVAALFAGTTTVVTPTVPTFVASTGVITIPTVAGVEYTRDDTGAVVTGTVTIVNSGQSLVIKAYPTAGHTFAPETDNDWQFTKS